MLLRLSAKMTARACSSQNSYGERRGTMFRTCKGLALGVCWRRAWPFASWRRRPGRSQ